MTLGKYIEIAHGLHMPMEVVTSRNGFTGQSGSGKTFAAGKLAEEMIEAGAQIIPIDPVGTWYGLKIGKDERTPGFPIVVFGGVHQDLPLTPDMGKMLAEVLARSGVSAVIDCSEFTMGELARFTAAFAEAFFDAKKRYKGPVHIFWEEAQSFAPQELPPDPHAALMLNRVVRLVKVGRNYGIGNTLITQEPQAVSKRALSQVNCLFIGYMQGEAARKAIKNWISDRAKSQADLDLVAELPKLKTGEMFAAEPKWFGEIRRVHILEKRSFDSSKTPHLGEVAPKPGRLADVDLSELRAALVQEVARVEATDPAVLQKRIRELEAQVKHGAPTTIEKIIEKPVVTEAQLQSISKMADVLLQAGVEANAAAKELRMASGGIFKGGVTVRLSPPPGPGWTEIGPSIPEAPKLHRHPLAPERTDDQAAKPNVRIPTGAAGLSDYAALLLRTLVQRSPMKLTLGQLASLSGRSARSSGFETAVALLKKVGLATKEGRHILPTDAGRKAAGAAPSVATSLAEIRAAWLRVLPDYERALMEAIAKEPSGLNNEGISRLSGKSHTSSGFETAMASLRRNGLIRTVQGVSYPTEEFAG